MQSEVYGFEGYSLSAEGRVLFDPSGEQVKLGPKAFDTLLELVRRHSEIVTRDQLLELVWPDTIVEENNLTQCISALRKAFEETPGQQRFIATVPGQGYKFVAEVQLVSAAEAGAPDPEASPEPSSVGLSRPVFLIPALVVLIVLVSSAYYIGFVLDAGVGEGNVRSLAVLPFNPMPGQQVDEAMQLGMTESLITQLGKSDKLHVRPLAASRKYGYPERDPVSAGRELGVDAVIDGNIQIADQRVRVTAKLVRVSDGRQIWAESFDEPFGDLFSLQDSISTRAAKALSVKLDPGATRRRTENIAAYELYLKGRIHQNRLVRSEVEKGVSLYERAILADPDYALPYVGIAESQRALLLSNDARALDVVPRAKVAALRAVELAPDLAEARSALGMIAFLYDWDWTTAEAELRKGIELDPGNPEILVFYAHLMSNLGRSEEARKYAAQARRLAPTNVLVSALEAQFHQHAGRYDEAIEELRSVIELNDNFWLAHHLLASVLADDGQYEEAEREALKAKKLAPFQTQSDAYRAFAFAAAGKLSEARDVLRELLAREKQAYVPPVNMAMTYAAIGEKEKAIGALERGYRERDVRMPFLTVDHKWDSIRNEPGFKALVARMKLD